MDFDPEEAFLTQLLLMNLDSQSQSQPLFNHHYKNEDDTLTVIAPSVSIEAETTETGATTTTAATGTPLLPTNRFTQDSTSTGRTLCEPEIFKALLLPAQNE